MYARADKTRNIRPWPDCTFQWDRYWETQNAVRCFVPSLEWSCSPKVTAKSPYSFTHNIQTIVLFLQLQPWLTRAITWQTSWTRLSLWQPWSLQLSQWQPGIMAAIIQIAPTTGTERKSKPGLWQSISFISGYFRCQAKTILGCVSTTTSLLIFPHFSVFYWTSLNISCWYFAVVLRFF